MSPLRLALLAVVALPLLTAAPPDATFAAPALKSGAAWTAKASNHLDLKITTTVGGQAMPEMAMPASAELACTVKIGKVDAQGVVDAELAFGRCVERKPNPLGASEEEETDFSEQTLTATRGADGYALAVAATKAAFAKMPEPTMIIEQLVGPAPLAEVLGGKSVKVGQAVELPVAVAKRLLGMFADDAVVKSVTLILAAESADGAPDAARFTAKASLVTPAGDEMPAEIRMELAGDWLVSKSTSRVLSIAMKGPVSMNGKIEEGGMKMEMTGSGDWTVAWSATAK